MKIKKLLVFMIPTAGCTLFLNLFPMEYAQAQKVIEWRMLSSWSAENPNVKAFVVPFVEKLNQRGAGKFKISWFGPESVPVFEQLKPVREGLFDAVYTNSSYHLGEVAVGVGLDLYPASSKEMRAAGLFKILDEAYRKKANVIYLAGTANGVGYSLYLKKKIDKADLTGLKIRTAPVYDPMIKALHGAPVRMPLGEIYSALEKGVMDGVMMMSIGVLDYKWYEVLKYIVRPRFGEVVCQILVNQDSWNRLPRDLQGTLTKTAIEIEDEGRALVMKWFESEEKELQRLGMEIVTLPPKEAEKFVNAYYERGWEELVLNRDHEFGPRLKEAVDRMRKK